MKLIVERDPFLAALADVAPRAKTSGPDIPALKHLLFSAADSKLSVTGNDLDCCTTAVLPADITDPGETAVPCAELYGLVKRLGRGAQIAFEMDGVLLKIKCGRASYNLPTLLADDMPKRLEAQTNHAIELSGEEIDRLLSRPQIAMSDDSTRVYLCGVYLHAADGKLSTCASDGCNLLRFTADKAVNGIDPVIVPRTVLPDFVKIGSEGGALSWTRNLISLATPAATITSKLVAGTFPDYGRFVPAEAESYIDVDREELIDACERLRAVNSTKLILLEWDENPDTLRATIAHSGIEEISCSAQNMEKGSIAIFPARTPPLLASLNGEVIRLFITDPQSPIRVRDMSDPDVIVVTMPGRIGAED